MKRSAQSGFGAILAILVLVILASLAAAIARFGTASQLASAQDVQSAQALQAADAGIQWGLYQALQPGGTWQTASGCNSGAQTLDLSASTGFRVTVQCTATASYPEGESAVGVAQSVRGLRIVATACNSASGCPDNAAATGQGYVERQREAVAYCQVGSGAGQCPP